MTFSNRIIMEHFQYLNMIGINNGVFSNLIIMEHFRHLKLYMYDRHQIMVHFKSHIFDNLRCKNFLSIY